MTSSLCRRVIPVVQVLRSLTRVNSRLCSSESHNRANKAQVNFTAASKTDDAPSQITMSPKYTSFDEREAPIILDVEEEKLTARQTRFPKDPFDDIFSRISEKRGENGVFELQELVEVMKLSRAENLCVIAMPHEARYVDYMLIVNAKSFRHMSAMAEFVRRVYKKKRHSSDHVPKIEGKKCQNWMALDLGNIALHIFSPSARELYDLESLWAVGAEFDPNSNKQEDDVVSLLQRHSYVLENFHPADS